MLKNEELKLVRPNANHTDDALALYRKYYSEEKEKTYGVLAIFITKKFNVEQMCQTTFNEYKKLLK